MKSYYKTIIVNILLNLFALGSMAKYTSPNLHEASKKEIKKLISSKNYFAERTYSNQQVDWMPSSDTADFKYVLMSAETGLSEAENLRYTIAKNLPINVKLVLLLEPQNLNQIKNNYVKYISLDRIIFAKASDASNGFWARDAFPYPVVNPQGQLSLVSAKYYRPFGASEIIANSVNSNMQQNNFTFVGGNLLADEFGNCFSVQSSRLFNTTEEDLLFAYGCKKVHFLKHLSGIGDVDEVIKPLPNRLMLTNTPEYKNELQDLGYQVILVPKIAKSYRTYINSLIVGKIVFMPTFGMTSDKEAAKVYEDLGYTVVGITSNTLSDQYHGSVHCQTMAFPDIDAKNLLKSLGLEQIN